MACSAGNVLLMTTNPATAALATDPRTAFDRAAALACDVVAGVRPDRLGAATPCPEYDVRALLGHLVSVLRRVAAVGRGEPALSVPQVTTDVPDDAWAGVARAAAEDIRGVWSDDAALTRELQLPFGTLPGAAALAIYTGEITTHTWDVAVATGQQPDWDDDVVAQALSAIRTKLPAAGRGPGIPFADAVPVPDDALPIDQLVAWQGRDPSWTPAA
jgi:uncharacterized protein (TIGR03086 family)